MVHPASKILKLVSDIPEVGADRLLIHAVHTPPQYFNGNTYVSPADDHTKFITIATDDLLDALRALAGREMVDDFLAEVEVSDTNLMTVALRETVFNLNGKDYRLTFSMNNRRVMAHFLLLDTDRTSKWKPALDGVSPNFLGGTKLRMGNRYGVAELELSAGQFAKVKALLLEIEQENFAPVKRD